MRGGAGSEHVKLVRDSSHARRLIRRSFGRGWNLKSRLHPLRERLWHFRRDRDLKSLWNIWRGIARLVIPTTVERSGRIERHYAYFQDFIPGNDHDIRVVVIGHRAFAVKRMVRSGDFRASGSGHVIYDPTAIPSECVSAAFSATRAIGAQLAGYDFIFADGKPLIVEISYGFPRIIYEGCPGYWNEDLSWNECKFHPHHFMAEDFVGSLERQSECKHSA